MPDTARYRFGPFVLDPPLRRLLRDSHEVALPPKAFDILVRLVRTRDRVLTKLDLLDEIWKHTAVTENTLAQRIREIRDALGDSPRRPQYVRTVSRVGYCFVGDVTEEGPGPQPVQEPGGDPALDSQRGPKTPQAGRLPSSTIPGRRRRWPLTLVVTNPGPMPLGVRIRARSRQPQAARARHDIFNLGLHPGRESAEARKR